MVSNNNPEIWILGDVNVYYLARGNDDRLKYIRLFKTMGLHQLISKFTRPNKRGGTCIYWIVTNSMYIKQAGTYDILILDHLPVYCIRKKSEENHKNVYQTVLDLIKKIPDAFSTLLSTDNRNDFENLDVDGMWLLLCKKMSFMCPFKCYKQRETVTPWLNAEVYKMMRNYDKYIMLFNTTGFNCYLQWARRSRNIVNNV